MAHPNSGSPWLTQTQGLHGSPKLRGSMAHGSAKLKVSMAHPNSGSPWLTETQGLHGSAELRVSMAHQNPSPSSVSSPQTSVFPNNRNPKLGSYSPAWGPWAPWGKTFKKFINNYKNHICFEQCSKSDPCDAEDRQTLGYQDIFVQMFFMYFLYIIIYV